MFKGSRFLWSASALQASATAYCGSDGGKKLQKQEECKEEASGQSPSFPPSALAQEKQAAQAVLDDDADFLSQQTLRFGESRQAGLDTMTPQTNI